MSEDDSEEDKQKIERWTESIGPRIADAIAHELDSEKVRQLVDHVSTRAVSLALWNLEDIGYCSFDFHLSAAEFRADGTCDSCGKRRTSHHLVFVCDYPEDPQEFESVEHPRGVGVLPDGPCVQCVAREADLREREATAAKPCEQCAATAKKRRDMERRIESDMHRRMLRVMGGARDVDAPRRAAAVLAASPASQLPLDEWRRDALRWGANHAALAAALAADELALLVQRFWQLIDLVDPPPPE